MPTPRKAGPGRPPGIPNPNAGRPHEGRAALNTYVTPEAKAELKRRAASRKGSSIGKEIERLLRLRKD